MTEKSPTVSVVIPTYNRAHLVGRAIQSALNQTHQDFEIIVVDDAFTDNTEEVAKSFNDPRIRYIRHEQNRGGSATRNTGIKVSRGEYIAFLNSDDEWSPEKLGKQMLLFSIVSENIGAVYYDGYGQADGYARRSTNSLLRTGRVYQDLLQGWYLDSTSLFVLRSDVFEKSAMFDETLPSFQDYDLVPRSIGYLLTVCAYGEEQEYVASAKSPH